jgi:hypothetical protein
MQHLRHLIESRPFVSRIPDQSLVKNAEDTGATGPWATRDANGSYALVYLPLGQNVTLNTGTLGGDQGLTYSWLDPRTGVTGGAQPVPESGEFAPPTSGPDCDWVLIVEKAKV